MSMRQQENKNRTREIIELREQGETYREIGGLFGVTSNRIYQICCREEWRRSQQKNAEDQGALGD